MRFFTKAFLKVCNVPYACNFNGASTRFRVTFLTFMYIQNLTKTLLVDKSTPSLRLSLNTCSRLLWHRHLLRILGTGPLTGDAVTSFVDKNTSYVVFGYDCITGLLHSQNW